MFVRHNTRYLCLRHIVWQHFTNCEEFYVEELGNWKGSCRLSPSFYRRDSASNGIQGILRATHTKSETQVLLKDFLNFNPIHVYTWGQL